VFTGSGDGTSNKHVNYDAHHINLKVASYSDDATSEPKHQQRLLGIVSTPDQSAEAQAEDLLTLVDDALQLFNRSPLAKRTKHFIRLVNAIAMCTGVNTDHCSKEKKYADVVKAKVTEAKHQLLGEGEILDRNWEEMDVLFDKAWEEMVEELGGQETWEALSIEDKQLQHAIVVKRTMISLGQEKYAEMSEEEKRELDFFVWTGCGCHKNANSVSGGNAGMMSWWLENDITPPILLANRDNAAVLQNVDSLDNLTPAELHALKSTTRGGVKAASIAGAIFNHKDDKKGQQDTFK
jgi:hypothetical protein